MDRIIDDGKKRLFKVMDNVKNIRKVTLSGEIIISTNNLTDFTNQRENIFAHVKPYVKSMENQHRDTEFKITNGLYDIRINLFKYNKVVYEPELLENIRIDFQMLLKQIYEFDDIYVKLDAIVEEHRVKELCEYKYLNNRTEVLYKKTK